MEDKICLGRGNINNVLFTEEQPLLKVLPKNSQMMSIYTNAHKKELIQH